MSENDEILTGEIVPYEKQELSTLPQLADHANKEHMLVMDSGKQMVLHAISAGEALLAAREQVPYGEWQDWLANNFLDRNVSTPRLYMRLARNKDMILGRGVEGVKEAARLVRGQPDARFVAAQRKQARKMASEGVSKEEIMETFGIAETTLYRWLNPHKDKEYKKKASRLTMAGRRAVQQAERERAVRQAGGSVAESYSLVRKALQQLDSALSETDKAEVKRSISIAINRLHIAEDEIVKAVKLF